MTRLKVYKVNDLIEKLNVSRSTVYGYLKQKKIKSFKIKGQYRIHEEKLQEFLQENSKKFIINKATQFVSIIELKKNYSYYKINKMVANKQLKKINKRYYENLDFADEERDIYQIDEDDFYHVDVYIPNGVVCQLSAAVYYELTTHIPWTVNVAVPRNQKVYNLPSRPSMTPIYYSDKRYKLGIIEKKSKNGFYRIYDLEKTICDFLAYRTKTDAFTFREIMNNYIQRSDKNLSKLNTYARKLRVRNILKTYKEVL